MGGYDTAVGRPALARGPQAGVWEASEDRIYIRQQTEPI